jgi:hypothetical protein
MESSLIDVVLDVVRGYFDVFLVEYTLVSTDETEHLHIFTQQAVDNVVPT